MDALGGCESDKSEMTVNSRSPNVKVKVGMTVNNNQQGNEIDWSRVNSRIKSKEDVAPYSEEESNSIARTEDNSPRQRSRFQSRKCMMLVAF